MKFFIKSLAYVFSLFIIMIVLCWVINWFIAKEMRESQERGIIELKQDVFSAYFSARVILINDDCVTLKNIQDTNEYIPPLRIISKTINDLSIGDTIVKNYNSNILILKENNMNYRFIFDIYCR